jgi:hypothetical protein
MFYGIGGAKFSKILRKGAASVVLNESLGSSDLAGELNGAERRLLVAVLTHKHRPG